MSDLVRKIGVEKIKVFDKDPDYFMDFYKDKALSQGYKGNLKFKKEGANLVIFVELISVDNNSSEYK
jgi:hypothetical protein